jgi:hypothetical protein
MNTGQASLARFSLRGSRVWIPAFAGMTTERDRAPAFSQGRANVSSGEVGSRIPPTRLAFDRPGQAIAISALPSSNW